MSETFVSSRSVTVEWGDCDPADIVFYPNYFRWFDASTANHFKAAGLPKTELISQFAVVGFPMVDTGATFHRPSKHGDTLTIETRFTGFGRSSFTVEHRLFNDGELAVEGRETRVLVKRTDDGGIAASPVPEEVKRRFES